MAFCRSATLVQPPETVNEYGQLVTVKCFVLLSRPDAGGSCLPGVMHDRVYQVLGLKLQCSRLRYDSRARLRPNRHQVPVV